MLQQTLTGAGFEVELAEDGVDGLERLPTATPDLIITDINMPRMDGFGFIDGVRKGAHVSSVPILVLTTESGDALQTTRPRGRRYRLDRKALRRRETRPDHTSTRGLKEGANHERSQPDVLSGM